MTHEPMTLDARNALDEAIGEAKDLAGALNQLCDHLIPADDEGDRDQKNGTHPGKGKVSTGLKSLFERIGTSPQTAMMAQRRIGAHTILPQCL
jgi:hypothetical protein